MKICSCCKTPCEDAETTCASCGASEFSSKCENCGTVFDSDYCPNCGTKAGFEGLLCPNCDTRYFTAACPNCGYSRVRKASDSNYVSEGSTHPAYRKAAVARSARTAGKVLLWILFFPIMLWRSHMHWVWKILLTILALFILLLVLPTPTQSSDSAPATTPVATENRSAQSTNNRYSSLNVIIMVNGDDATCKRVMHHENGLSLVSNNPAYPPRYFTAQEAEHLPIQVIGKVVELRGKF